MLRKLLLGAVVGGALLAGASSRSMAAPYVLTTSAPRDPSTLAVVDTVWTCQSGTPDTLMFGFVADEMCVWIDSGGDSASVEAVVLGGTLEQRGGTAPPDSAEGAKARYGANAASAAAHPIDVNKTYCLKAFKRVLGVIVTGTGATPVLGIQAHCNKER